jgi:hypothetical protein
LDQFACGTNDFKVGLFVLHGVPPFPTEFSFSIRLGGEPKKITQSRSDGVLLSVVIAPERC